MKRIADWMIGHRIEAYHIGYVLTATLLLVYFLILPAWMFVVIIALLLVVIGYVIWAIAPVR